MPELNYVATVYHGLDIKKFPFEPEPEMREPYLAFLGRISPEKGVHLAIDVAERTGWQLKMAGKVDYYDQQYWEQQIAPRVDGRRIEYLGEMNDEEKVLLLSRAAATLCLIQWPEPFGLVMIESLACGTPVVAIRNGSVPEVITDGKTGIICADVEGVINAVTPAGSRFDSRVQRLSRRVCRLEVEQRFSAQRMTDNYEKVYARLVGAEHASSHSEQPERERSSGMSARAAWG
jgi:glycosyltransferase involved in cell wall biosynthesis